MSFWSQCSSIILPFRVSFMRPASSLPPPNYKIFIQLFITSSPPLPSPASGFQGILSHHCWDSTLLYGVAVKKKVHCSFSSMVFMSGHNKHINLRWDLPELAVSSCGAVRMHLHVTQCNSWEDHQATPHEKWSCFTVAYFELNCISHLIFHFF